MADGRSLRNVSARNAINALVRAGGVPRSGKGSHINVKMPNGNLVTIPRHGKLKIGLLRAALRRAGLSVDEFTDLL